ncbi:DHHA1 domain-containing protein [Nanoarchaeota archaeon]
MTNSLNEAIDRAVSLFKKIDKNETVRVISHLDADGICAASILIKALTRENLKHSLSIITQLNKNIIEEYQPEKYNYYFFIDLGSGQIRDLAEQLPNKTIFILDHHEPQDFDPPDNIVHVNSHEHDVDGDKQISGAGMVFLFAKSINKINEDLAHIAIIGSIGDVQENKGFQSINNSILDIAIKQNKLDVQKGLKFFGIRTKPLYKLLEYSSDPYIPEVSGSETKAIQFLQSLNINPKDDKGNWRKLIDLTDDETKQLIAGIVMKRINEKDPTDVLGNIYTLIEEPEGPTKDAKEFSTLLNACGRLDKASLGIGTCLGDSKIRTKAINQLKNYRKEIVNSIRWYEDSKKKESPLITENKNFMIINAEDNVLHTIIGTLASILAKSNNFKNNYLIMSLARGIDHTTKVSIRVSGRTPTLDCREIVQDIVDIVGGEAGGHMNAAGAFIQTKDEDKFVETAKDILNKISIEEKV